MTRLPADPASDPQALEARVASLEAALHEVTTRLTALEGKPVAAAQTPETQPTPAAMEPLALPELPSSVGLMSQIGKICLILGGGFFIRGLVDAGKLPSTAGAALGLAYALTWALVALRRPVTMAATFDTVASILIAYPLLVESTVRFKILTPGATAILLLVTALTHAIVAHRRELRALGWIATLATLGAGLLLMAATQSLEPFLGVLFALALGLLWFATDARWEGLRWPAALAVDLGVVVMVVLASWDGGPPEAYKNLSPTLAMGFALLLVLSYVGTFAWRMLRQSASVGVFEWAQTALVLMAGLGGALRIATGHGAGGAAVGLLAVLGGLGGHLASRPFAKPTEGARWNFTYFGLLGMALLILGGLVLASTTIFAVLAGAAGFGAMFMAQRLRRTVLLVQSALYLVAAGTASGLFAWTFRAFLGPQGPGSAPTPGALWVLAALAGSVAFFLIRGLVEGFQSRIRPVLLVEGALAALGLGALAIWSLGRLIQAPGTVDAAKLALSRTGVLALLVLALAALSRRATNLQVKWLVYPILALATLKFLMEDMAVGHALTLFPAFMFLGATFILAPRLMKVNS